MALSETDIANWALDLLGETPITDLSAPVERAEALLRAWPGVRDRLLRRHVFHFAKRRKSLAASAAAPAFGFAYAYAIDADVTRVLQVGDFYPAAVLDDYVGAPTESWTIEDGSILTDLVAPLPVIWVVSSTPVGNWDSCFARLMACDLADRASTRLTSSESIKARINAERREAMSDAIRSNAVELPPRQIADGSWLASRLTA